MSIVASCKWVALAWLLSGCVAASAEPDRYERFPNLPAEGGTVVPVALVSDAPARALVTRAPSAFESAAIALEQEPAGVASSGDESPPEEERPVEVAEELPDAVAPAEPTPPPTMVVIAEPEPVVEPEPAPPPAVAQPKQARAWFVGDSITFGSDSVGHNGFRKSLHDHAISKGYLLDFVGSLSNGDFADNQHDGWSGYSIREIVRVVDASLGASKPLHGLDLVLLMIGTNSIGLGYPEKHDSAVPIAQYAALLEQIIAAEPQVRIVVTTIIDAKPSLVGGPAGIVAKFNARLPAVWDAFDRSHAGSELIRWDAFTAIGAWDFGSAAPHFADAVHPNDRGYGVLGQALIEAVDPFLGTLVVLPSGS